MKQSFNSFCKGVSTMRKGAIQVLLVLMLLAWIIVPDAAAFGLATISISNSSVMEGNSGTADMVFTVTRTGDVTSTVEVGYSTANGTALAGIDYTAETGTVIFPSGETSATIGIPVVGNTSVEGDRSFTVQLTGVVNTYGPPVSFTAKQDFATGFYPFSVTAGDLNGDGKSDLVSANMYSNTLSVRVNTTAPGTSTPTFAEKQDFYVDESPNSVAMGDFNGDGRLDLANSNSNATSISVLLNTTVIGASTLSFVESLEFGAGFVPYSMATEDFNGDGKLDLVCANSYSDTLGVLLNTTTPGASTAAFADMQEFGVDGNPYSVSAADLNGDGKPDLASANFGGESISVLLNTTIAGASTVPLRRSKTSPQT